MPINADFSSRTKQSKSILKPMQQALIYFETCSGLEINLETSPGIYKNFKKQGKGTKKLMENLKNDGMVREKDKLRA
jgi:hypothetical protein